VAALPSPGAETTIAVLSLALLLRASLEGLSIRMVAGEYGSQAELLRMAERGEIPTMLLFARVLFSCLLGT